ncbi:heavy metal sensor histidine kinase [Paludibacterium sp.]|uniref:heavy metal sensor histidine kinase n=1 Tax=Paludibacterium sp. TaxID=1917523 RepID=UPI0025D8ED3D|nr:heavy metal sensor histidine kinase [Paludibacterium sp.]MBV8649431.1 heavy metal sensor histidine kinase [Paludibacterium sp.]
MPGRPSITLRLTLLFSLVSTGVLFAMGLLLTPLVERHFASLDGLRLDSATQLVRHVLTTTSPNASPRLLQDRLDELMAGQRDVAVVLFSSQWQPVYVSPGIRLSADWLAHARADTARLPAWPDADGRVWRGHAQPLPAQGRAWTGGTVFAAVDLGMHQHFMTSFRLALWLVIGLAAVVSGLLGWWATHRGLAPLSDIRKRTAQITINNLNDRLPEAAMPVELAGVVTGLNVMLARLEGSFKKLTDFSSDIAHELRTPVNRLLTQNQVMLSKPRSADDYQDVLASNIEALEQLSGMISDMLFLAKASNDLVVPKREPIKLHEETRHVLDFYEALIEEARITVRLTGDAETSGDRLMMRRAIGNLVSNAVRHTPPDGQIEIVLSRDADRLARFSISNTGPTIEARHLERLFDRFYRGELAKHEKTEGSGLGLAITKSILQAHRGGIQAASGDGRTIFTFWLPVK